MRYFLWTLTLLFTLFAGWQFNDPDPWTWVAVYASVAIHCGLAASDRYYPTLLGVTVGAVLVLTLSYLPELKQWLAAGSPSLAQEMKTETPEIELAREFFGLLISLLVLIFLSWRWFSIRKTASR